MLVFVALALVLPEAYRADIEKVVEGSVVAAGAEEFLCLRYIFFEVVRVGVCVRGVGNDEQSTCCVRHLRRGETVERVTEVALTKWALPSGAKAQFVRSVGVRAEALTYRSSPEPGYLRNRRYSLNTHLSFDPPPCERCTTGDPGRGFRREIVHVPLSIGERRAPDAAILRFSG